jgi:glutamine amidotransferase
MSAAKVAIVDYGMGNVGSILNMLRKLRVPAELTRDPARLEQAEKLIVPGVGAFDHGITKLRQLDLFDRLTGLVIEQRKPVLGICLGMQLMTRRSDEGKLAGLGWLDAETVRFQFDPGPPLRVPHMGWTRVRVMRPCPVFTDTDPERRFYFVHSYYVRCKERQDVTAVASYGLEFDAAFSRGNIHGVQFHPEKSHRFGLELLETFAKSA